MIRVRKSENVPDSLVRTSAYDGEDVKRQLLVDQYEKCYICERIVPIDFVIEHKNSRQHYVDLRQNWSNLFLSCGYCNGKKLHNFDHILAPQVCNVESEIQQLVDYNQKKVVLTPLVNSYAHTQTVTLLDQVFNGSGRIRKIKEEKFFERFISLMNLFAEKVNIFLQDRTAVSRMAVMKELDITQEFLGFKYWIIKSHPILNAEFSEAVAWNKVV